MKQDLSRLLSSINKIHFVGIGGSGMFPLVEILHSKGYSITGSDVNDGDIIQKERKLGIPVTLYHDERNVSDAEALVVTAALIGKNPEVMYADRNNIPVIERAELLGYLTSNYERSFCISGTHGKTTATSMLTSIFVKANKDPSAVIGGKLPLIDGYGLSGKSDLMVCEACEYVDTFLKLSPAYSVILNVDADHLDFFGDLDGVKRSFKKFAEKATIAVVANGDDQKTIDTLKNCKKPIIYFGKSDICKYKITDIYKRERAFYSFSMSVDGEEPKTFDVYVPGVQNVYNAAASVALAYEAGCTAEEIQQGLESFKGAGRRFEQLGVVGDITIYDDYAHHPAEIEVTLNAAKDMGYKRVIAVFQPFTYTRTYQHLDSFAKALSIADKVVLTEIMGSREVNILDIYSKDLCVKIENGEWFGSFENVAERVASIAKPGDMVITLGCGDVYKVARMIIDNLLEKHS